MGSIQYLKEELLGGNIVTRIFNGEILKEDIMFSFKHMIEDKLFDADSKGLITIISNSTIKMDISDIENMVSFMSANNILSKLKIAVVSDDPDKIILPTLVHFKIGDKLRPFNNIEEAKEWIINNDVQYL